MAKKIVRGVTNVENIESFDRTLTNINDILSDGQDTFVHTKKGKTESYYKLTDSLKSITSDNSDLITVTKDDTTNTATLHPKHDAQKEQSLESTRGTVSIQKGSNGTNTTTKVDTNPEKVLEHVNLLNEYGISKTTSGNTTKLGIEYTKVNDGFDLNTLAKGFVRGWKSLNAPTSNDWYFVEARSEGNFTIQRATALDSVNSTYVRLKSNYVWGQWRQQVGDKSVIDDLLSQKQNTLSSNTSIGVLTNNQLRQLFALKQTYTHANGLLKTHVKNVAENTSVSTSLEEFNFTVKINKNAENIVVTLNEHDTTAFGKIMTKYGSNNTVNISGCVFTLNGSNLTITTTNNTAQNYVTTFSDILD